MDFRRLKYYCHNSLILVTSGDRQILSAIAEVLTTEKYNFITETSGEKAWEIILQKKRVDTNKFPNLNPAEIFPSKI